VKRKRFVYGQGGGISLVYNCFRQLIGRYSRLSGVLLLLINAPTSWAFEAFNSTPGSRAMGMAGVFSAQADDSSAIWYNPAGLKQSGMSATDITIDIGEQIASDDNFQFSSPDTAITYAAAYQNNLPYLQRWTESVGLGIAYHSPYVLALNVNENIDPTDSASATYGLVDAKYQQVSGVMAASLKHNLSIGATVDMVWADIDCRDYEFCVKNAPYGMGASIGLLYGIYQSDRSAVNVAAAWRSSVSVDYNSTPNSGIGSVLGDYIPDRPGSFNIGVNMRYFAASMLVNANFIFERTMWAAAAGSAPSLSNYNKLGLGSEFLFPTESNNFFAVRAGVTKAMAEDGAEFGDVDIFALGVGLSIYKNHVIDLAWQSRDAETEGKRSVNILSISYSLQY